LDIYTNKIGDQGAQYLAEGLKLNKVSNIHVSKSVEEIVEHIVINSIELKSIYSHVYRCYKLIIIVFVFLQ